MTYHGSGTRMRQTSTKGALLRRIDRFIWFRDLGNYEVFEGLDWPLQFINHAKELNCPVVISERILAVVREYCNNNNYVMHRPLVPLVNVLLLLRELFLLLLLLLLLLFLLQFQPVSLKRNFFFPSCFFFFDLWFCYY